jgi:hypothetical protein
MVDKEFKVRGFVKNEGDSAYFKLQRQLPPQAKLSFSAAFLATGTKSGQEGEAFVKWLRENIFPGPEWGFYREEGIPFFSDTSAKSRDVAPEAPPVSDTEGAGAGKVMSRKKSSADRKVDITPSSIIDAEYSKAKELIETCRSKDVLKKALTLSQHFANKGEHMRHLMRRLEQVQ